LYRNDPKTMDQKELMGPWDINGSLWIINPIFVMEVIKGLWIQKTRE